MVFTLAENTAQSISLVSDTRLPSNFNTTKSALYFLLLKFVFPKLSGWSFSQLFLPGAVFLHLLGVLFPRHRCAVDPPETHRPLWFIEGRQLIRGHPGGTGGEMVV